MGWVVKQWRLDTLERLLADAARAELADVRAAAGRDARRAHRAADRTTAAAAIELASLEEFGKELRSAVRDWRAWLRDPGAASPSQPGDPPEAATAPAVPVASPIAPAPPVAAAAPAPIAPAPPAAPAAPAVVASREAAPAPIAPAPPAAPAAPAVVASREADASPARGRRSARASLHSSALTELFRATATR